MSGLTHPPPPVWPPKNNASSIHYLLPLPHTPCYSDLTFFYQSPPSWPLYYVLWSSQNRINTQLCTLSLHLTFLYPLCFNGKTVPPPRLCFQDASQMEAIRCQLSFMSVLGNRISSPLHLTATSRPLVLYPHQGIKNSKTLPPGVLDM